MHRLFRGLLLGFATLGCAWLWAAGEKPATVIEGESAVAKGADKYRDQRAANKKCAGIMLAADKPVVAADVELPPGDYEATVWLLAEPIEILHGLAVRFTAGNAGWTLGQIQFDAKPQYQPFPLRFFHGGGKCAFRLSAAGTSGFSGMRKDMTEKEKAEYTKGPEQTGLGGDEAPAKIDEEDVMAELDDEKSVTSFKVYDLRLLCDRIDVRLLRPAPVAVTAVAVDKIHYLPGETVKATATVKGCTDGGKFQFVAEDVVEVDAAREVCRRDVEVAKGKAEPVAFEFKLDDREFGHELHCSLVRDGQPVHSGSALFGVSRNVYRVGITADAGAQDMQTFTRAQSAELMNACKAAYANYFERFAWAPCDYSNLAPKTEKFFSGQTQYPGSITGFKALLEEAHKVGVKGISYGKACAAGIEGFKTFQRYPDIFHSGPGGLPSEAFSVFYLERMLANDYNLHAKPIDGGWQHWASLWTRFDLPLTLQVGTQAIIDSVEMFGWDGIRWDGHFVGYQKPFIDGLNAKYPNFAHGYNIAFANPGSKLFLPPGDDISRQDFDYVAANHGLLMDESVRDWSQFSPNEGDTIRPFYEALGNEADYMKRVGGLPLLITFDTASKQDAAVNVLCGLAAGHRYTYMTSPGDFPYGPLPKFLTRYSAFVWDDTKRVAKPEQHVSVTVGNAAAVARQDKLLTGPWYSHTTWLRALPGGRQQLLVNLVNPPVYRIFTKREQAPPPTLTDVAVRVKTPAGAKLVRSFHCSPDLGEGLVMLNAVADGDGVKVVLPRVRTWSIVAFEYEGAPNPAFALTTPVEDALAALKANAETEAKKAAEQKAKAGIGPSAEPKPVAPYYEQYDKVFNADAEAVKKLEKPAGLEIRRDGRLDVLHVRGPFSWLNPVESAVALTGGGHCQPAWVDLVGFKLGPNGCLDEFPGSVEELFAYDVLVLDNLHAAHLGQNNRVRIAEFVRQGGGLVVFGGYCNLSMGADHNSSLAELEPVRITKFKNNFRDNKGLPLAAAKPDFFGDSVKWAEPGQAFDVETSDLKPGVEVLVTVGGKPGIVAQTVGQGRVITVLFNPHGDYAAGTRPYWQWSQWPRVLAACLKWVGAGSEKVVNAAAVKRALDKSKPIPEELGMEAMDLNSKEFTARLKAARDNMVDAENARALLEAAIDNVDKIEDTEILQDVAERAGQYVDKSFGPLAGKLLNSDHDFLRQAGYQILGLTGDKQHVPALIRGLSEKEPTVVREVLIGLGRLGDPAGATQVRNYVKAGSEKLLALAVLKRLGDAQAVAELLPIYEAQQQRGIRMKSGRKSLENDLWGGVSFKLQPAQRRQLMNDHKTLLRTQAAVRHDVDYTVESLAKLNDAELAAVGGFLAKTENPELTALAYAIYAKLPPPQADSFRQQMKTAKLESLRFLAE